MTTAEWRERFSRELVGNILPFWAEHTVDEANGGFYGALTNDLHVLNEVPRSAVLCARILWTFSTAYRLYHEPRDLRMARHAYDYLTRGIWDRENGGVYWMVDAQGRPINDRKHIYAQGFAIYGSAEFYRATGTAESLRMAQGLFRLIETRSYDAVNGGNIECCSRTWGALADMRLSDKEPDCRKSMNTLLHLLEAYTNLLRVWDDAELRAKLRGLLLIFTEHVVDPRSCHLKLFFDDAWNSLSPNVSFGHDIEASWLLVEAAEVLGEPELISQARYLAPKMALAVYDEGLDADGSVHHEATPAGIHSSYKEWWAQAEGVVGFYNAYQLLGRAYFAGAAARCWNVIETKLIDRTNGDWFKQLQPNGTPDMDHVKVGPWECPYHHSRMCFEMLGRLG